MHTPSDTYIQLLKCFHTSDKHCISVFAVAKFWLIWNQSARKLCFTTDFLLSLLRNLTYLCQCDSMNIAEHTITHSYVWVVNYWLWFWLWSCETVMMVNVNKVSININCCNLMLNCCTSSKNCTLPNLCEAACYTSNLIHKSAHADQSLATKFHQFWWFQKYKYLRV